MNRQEGNSCYPRPIRVLITGGAGFVGSHLADLLVNRGDEVVILDDLSTGRAENIKHLITHPRVEFVEGSILDTKCLNEIVPDSDLIYHLAAAVGVNLIIERPLESLMTNIRGTENVIEAAHRYETRILITSTSEIYGKNDSDSLGEDDDRILGSPLKSRWSYSEAKAIDEILAYTYWREMGLPTVIVRLFNTVGPRQTGTYGMVVPRFVNQAIRQEPITVYGDGSQRRCFCSVLDVVSGMVSLAEHPKSPGQVFNLGGTEEVTIQGLAERVIKLTGSSSPILFVPYDEAYEQGFEDMPRRVPDVAKARALIGFEPLTDLNEIIRTVIADQEPPPVPD